MIHMLKQSAAPAMPVERRRTKNAPNVVITECRNGAKGEWKYFRDVENAPALFWQVDVRNLNA